MDFSGPQVSINHLWHHRDHVAFTPLTSVGGKKNLGFQVRARTRIHELTNEVNDVIYFEMQTVRLDNREFTFKKYAGGAAPAFVYTHAGRREHLLCRDADRFGNGQSDHQQAAGAQTLQQAVRAGMDTSQHPRDRPFTGHPAGSVCQSGQGVL